MSRANARAAQDRASHLVDVLELDDSLRADVRYATDDNFLGRAVYPAGARVLLQRPAAEALVRVHQGLAPRGVGLLLYDGYRPWHVTKLFWDEAPPAWRPYLADPARGSRHNRGCAVDLTLCDRATGRPLEMPSAFDHFGPEAHVDWAGATPPAARHRALLRDAMTAEGFLPNPLEWWHFDHESWEQYPVLDTPL